MTAKKNLVIVESPTKVKAIKRFLGNGYDVVASNGHVRDLPKSRMGVDTDHDYEPQYITIRGKGDLLAGLKLDKTDKKCSRITFNEITKAVFRLSAPVSRLPYNRTTSCVSRCRALVKPVHHQV